MTMSYKINNNFKIYKFNIYNNINKNNFLIKIWVKVKFKHNKNIYTNNNNKYI